MTAPTNSRRTPPFKTAGLALALVVLAIVVVVYLQFRGDLTAKTRLTMMTSRSGLVMDPGSKVTYNGVEVGRVAAIAQQDVDGSPAAKLTLDIDPKYVHLIPSNVDANITASTVFGNKYVAFTSPKNPTPQRISTHDVIDARSVTTEFNTLFETITSISQKVDPVKLNETLSATADALTGLGTKFGQSLVKGNQILRDLNPQMPQIRSDIQGLAKLAELYSDASPDLWAFLKHAVTTASTLNDERSTLDDALLAAVGFGDSGQGALGPAEPFLVRGQADLIPTAQLLDKYSPELFCTVRNFAAAAPKVSETFGGNGYSLRTEVIVDGAKNSYIYPDNLPRINAVGGPGGAPGCWQPITRELWPAPYLVSDTGASIAPFNHFGLGQPILKEYVWGRQVGENTINP